VRCPSWKWSWTLDRRVALLSVFIEACVGCTCESGCRPVRRERHGRGGDVLLRVLRLMESEGRPVVGYPVV
jgi:hypothetical protein